MEVRRLERLRDDWLDTPDYEELQGMSPREVIERERLRLPMALAPGQAVIDHDCPLCQMLAEGHGPVFWHLDGCNMDWDFAFSFHHTLAEYQKEQQDRAEFSRKWNAQQAERQRLGLADRSDGPWQRTLVANGAELPVGLRLFGIGMRLAEVIVDLKEPTEDRVRIDRLNRDFGNLRDVVSSPDTASLVEPILDRFGETLEDVAVARADLQEKCDDLRQSLRGFLEPTEAIEDLPDSGDDIPL